MSAAPVHQAEKCSRCSQPAGYKPDGRIMGWGSEVLCTTHFVNATAKLRPATDLDVTENDTPDGYRYTDAGNARRLVDLHGDRLRHVSEWGTWHVWDGRRWVVDHGDAAVTEAAKDVARHLLAAVETMTGNDRVKLVRFANRSESATSIRAAISLARTARAVRISHQNLDADRYMLNLSNGTYDLLMDKLVPHQQNMLITKLVDIPFVESATCPRFISFLERVIPDAEVRDFVQRAAGYCLTGDVGEQVMFFLIGIGANGKSVFLNILRKLLGDYAVVAPRDLLLVQRHEPHPTSTASLFGARIATAVETEAGSRLAEAKVKELTGGDELVARRMREDFWPFTPTHKLWLAANYRPTISGSDEGIWRRIRVVPFTVTIPPDERDAHLLDYLVEHELPGILAWAIEGYRKFRTDGLGLPDAVNAATVAYRAEQDVVGQFLTIHGYELRPHAVVKAGDLRRQYEAWCDAEGIQTIGPTAWVQALAGRGLTQTRRKNGRFWEGISACSLDVDTPSDQGGDAG